MKKIQKVISLLMVLCLLSTCFLTVSYANENDEVHFCDGIMKEILRYDPHSKIPHLNMKNANSFFGTEDTNPNSKFSFYDQLNDRQKYMYGVVLSQLTSGNGFKNNFQIEMGSLRYVVNGTIENAKQIVFNDCIYVISALMEDNPWFFWPQTAGFEGLQYKTQGYTILIDTVPLQIEYDGYAYYGFSDVQSKYRELMQKVNSFPVYGVTRYDKVKSIHDELARRITYRECAMAHEPTGALLNGYAVCEGYSEAFQLICQRENIPCISIAGLGNGGPHKWNYVKMDDGKWYLVDVTWDDEESHISYNFFLNGSNDYYEDVADSNLHRPNGEIFEGYPLQYPQRSSVKYEKRNCWVNDNGKYYYVDAYGNLAKGWKIIYGQYYYFDDNGIMQTGWRWIDGKCYYFYQSGAMAYSTIADGSYVSSDGSYMAGNWIEDAWGFYYQHYDGVCTRNNFERINGNWFYFNNSGYMTTGWQYVNGHYYYMNQGGAMLTGWQYIDNHYYYMMPSGAMATGFQNINGVYYYFNDWGVMQTGWKVVNGVYYYMNDWGVMQTGWLNQNGNYYYLNRWGAMQTGWLNLNGTYYYFNNWGIMQTGWKNINGKYFYFSPWGAMQTGWQYIDGNYYYLTGSGEMATGFYNVNGTYYYFAPWGGMQTGWQYINGNYYYMNQSGAMLSNTWCWIDGNCYFFYDWGGMAQNTWIGNSYVNSSGVWVA